MIYKKKRYIHDVSMFRRDRSQPSQHSGVLKCAEYCSVIIDDCVQRGTRARKINISFSLYTALHNTILSRRSRIARGANILMFTCAGVRLDQALCRKSIIDKGF